MEWGDIKRSHINDEKETLMTRLRFSLLVMIICLLGTLPAAAQEATPEAVPVDLTETFTSEDGTVSFSYPADWILDVDPDSSDNGMFFAAQIAPNQEVFDNADITDELQPGQVVVRLAIANVLIVNDTDPGINPDMSVEEFLQILSENASSGDGVQFGDIQLLELSDRTGAQINLIQDDLEIGTILAYVENRVVVLILLNAAPGEVGMWESTAVAILDSVVYSPPEVTPEATELTERYVSSDENLVFQYPTDWYVRESGSDLVYLSNTENALDASFGDALAPGEVQIQISLSTVEDLGADINVPITNDDSPLKILQGLLKAAPGDLGFGDPQVAEIGGMRAARVDYLGNGFSGTAWIVELRPGMLFLVQMLAAPEENTLWQATAIAIAETVQYAG
jgi:hypothetical protein